jgi:hypothetical protein
LRIAMNPARLARAQKLNGASSYSTTKTALRARTSGRSSPGRSGSSLPITA